MLSTPMDYVFNNLGRIGNDATDRSQQTIQNANHVNAVLTNHFSGQVSDSHIHFATAHPGIIVNGVNGGWTQQYTNDSYHQLNTYKGNQNPLASGASLNIAKNQMQKNPLSQQYF